MTSSPPSQAIYERTLRGVHVLLVDDDDAVREIATDMLTFDGATVVGAADSDTAIAHLGSSIPVDVLVTDLVLTGELDGIDLIAQGRSLRPGLRAILATGYGREDPKLDNLAVRNIELLEKPLRRKTLAEAIARALSD